MCVWECKVTVWLCKVYAFQLWQLILQFDAIYNAIEFEINVLCCFTTTNILGISLMRVCLCEHLFEWVYILAIEKGLMFIMPIGVLYMLYIWSMFRSFFSFSSSCNKYTNKWYIAFRIRITLSTLNNLIAKYIYCFTCVVWKLEARRNKKKKAKEKKRNRRYIKDLQM